MALKWKAKAQKYGGLVGRAGPSVQRKSGTRAVLFEKGGVCCGRQKKGQQGEKGIKWLCPAWER